MNTQASTSTASVLAKLVAGEDLQDGDFVSVLNEVYEFPSFFWASDSGILPPQEPVRVQLRARDGGTPLEVQSICLPFVLVKSPVGKHRTLDVRQSQLVRLTPDYARTAWKAMCQSKKHKRRRTSHTR